MVTVTTTLTQEQQQAILNWPENNDLPIFPADTRNKKIWLSSWQDFDFSKTDFNTKLASGEYDKGIAIRTGKTLSGKYYAVALDFDGWDAVEEWFGNWERVVSLSKKTLVEWHQDMSRIHVIFLSKSPFPNRKIHIKNAFLEVRCERNALFASPSIHQDGQPYSSLGTNQLAVLDETQILALKAKINTISQGYMSDLDKNEYDQWLDLPTTILGENQGRHDATKFKIIRYYWKYNGEWLDLSDDQRFEWAWKWHIEHCKPPRSREEFDRICQWVEDKFRAKRDELHSTVKAQRKQVNHNPSSKPNDASTAKEYSIYKYSKGISLAEQIILRNESVFLQITDGEPVISRQLDLSEEQNIILNPYQHGISGAASPIVPIKFRDVAEIEYFINQARKETIESIYLKHKSLWKNFVAAKDQSTIIFFAVDSVYSHFQDLFETTHYDLIYGPPGSGKGAILITFSLLGYRVVLAADLNGANLLDLYGSAEICQITIAEDELDDIHRDPDKHKIYKIGYDFSGTTQRTLDGNTSNRNNRLYHVYGFKIGAAESQIESKVLAGFYDRGFQFHSIKGNPRYSVKKAMKEMMKPVEKQLPKYRAVISQLEYTRKLTFIFRINHHDDMIEEIETNLDGRALELTGPQIRLFSSKKLSSLSIDQGCSLLKKEILPALSEFLRQKGELTRKTIDGIVYDAIIDLMSRVEAQEEVVDIVTGRKRILYKISNADICNRVKELVDGTDPQNPNEQAFYSVEYGKITYKHILKLCRDRLMAEPDSVGSGNNKMRALVFDKETVQKVGKTFEVVNKIEILPRKDEPDTEDSEQDREVWRDWRADFTDARDNNKNGTMGRKYSSPEYVDSNDRSEQLVNNNNASAVSPHIIHENGSKTIKSESISETSNSSTGTNRKGTIYSKIDPKIVPSSQIVECQAKAFSSHRCPYCSINGYDIEFDSTDLLERHVIQRHAGWTAYPGPPDLEKYKQELNQKGKLTNG